MGKAKGFTLIELMITVAIISILAAVVYPSYADYILRGKIVEALDVLSSMRARQEQHFLDFREYDDDAGNCGVELPDPTRYWTFECEADDTTYTVSALGVPSGGTGGFTYTINQANVRATDVDTGAPSGWSGNAGCWVTRRGGIC